MRRRFSVMAQGPSQSEVVRIGSEDDLAPDDLDFRRLFVEGQDELLTLAPEHAHVAFVGASSTTGHSVASSHGIGSGSPGAAERAEPTPTSDRDSPVSSRRVPRRPPRPRTRRRSRQISMIAGKMLRKMMAKIT